MKNIPHITLFIVMISCLFGSLTVQAGAEGGTHTHTHEEKKAGPNGGRLITSVDPHAEFFVTSDRFAQITFVDSEGVAIAPDGQAVSLIGGDRSNPTKLSFVPVGGVLRSAEPLPDVPNLPIILSIKPASDAQTTRDKFYLNQSVCGGCSLEEYACTCGH